VHPAAQRDGSNAVTFGTDAIHTLGLVFARDRAIELYKPVPYYTVSGKFLYSTGAFNASWSPKENQRGLDPEGRLVDPSIKDYLVESVSGSIGFVTDSKEEIKTEKQPLVLTLSGLNAQAYRKYRYSEQEVRNACQSLYETHKLISNPNTECGYLPEAKYSESPQVFEAIKSVIPELEKIVNEADPSLKSEAWNDRNIATQHGIIPTKVNDSENKLSAIESRIYELISLTYLAQFYPSHQYRKTTLELNVTVTPGEAKEEFMASGEDVIQNGWRSVIHSEDERVITGGINQPLPSILPYQTVTCDNVTSNVLMTKKPPRFTEQTLIQAMEVNRRYGAVQKNKYEQPEAIDTPATRASIISALICCGFLEKKREDLIATPVGRSLLEALPKVEKEPRLNKLYGLILKNLEKGEGHRTELATRQVAYICSQVARLTGDPASVGGKREPRKAGFPELGSRSGRHRGR
jgi:DNA topoisomerase-3